MAQSYILIDVSGRAIMLSEQEIQREAAERMASGEVFQIYRAEPMRLQFTLTPAAGAEAPFAPSASKPAPAPAKKAVPARAAKPARKRAKAAKASKSGSSENKVGRPRVNVGPCVVPGCKNPQKTRGLCSAHYQQHRRNVRIGKPGLMPARGGNGATAAAEAAPAAAAAAAPKKAGKKSRARKAPAKKTARKAAPKKAARKAARKQSKKTEAAAS